jgi:hypothetical protein
MKKIFLFATLAFGAITIASCGSSAPKGEGTDGVEVVDTAAILAKEVPSVEKVDSIVLGARELNSQLEKIYDQKHVDRLKQEFGDFDVDDHIDKEVFLITMMKNAELTNIEDFYKEAKKVNPDSLGVAMWIDPCGDMYEKFSIALFDANMLQAQVKRIEAAGYSLASESEEEGMCYKKTGGKCFWVVNPKKNVVEAHFDYEASMMGF